jgi:hypothetical protein
LVDSVRDRLGISADDEAIGPVGDDVGEAADGRPDLGVALAIASRNVSPKPSYLERKRNTSLLAYSPGRSDSGTNPRDSV